jgi:LCP family protein required for cell wall assembly
MMSALGLFSFSFLRRIGIASLVVAVIAAGVMSLGAKAGQHEFAKRNVVHLADGVLVPLKPAQPANYLLIGHDAAGNSDTMMVIHIDPSVPTPLLVSFPRDLMVEIPGHGRAQLNSAIGSGGIPLLIETFKTYFSIPINHFLEVDFASFPEIVSAIGGHVNVWFSTPVHDPYIGLNIEQAGCVALDPQMALAYARSRHYYVPDDLAHPAVWQWNYDPGLPESAYRGGKGWTALGSDVDRIPRQQYFLRTLAQAAIKRTDDNPARLFGLVPAVMSHLTTDQSLTLNELKSLVNTFRKLKPADIEMTTLPWMTDPADTNRLVVDSSKASTLLLRLANFLPVKPFLPPLVNARTVRVKVVNGSGIAELGARAFSEIVAAGFKTVGPAVDADRSNYARSLVRWGPNDDVKGVTVTYATGAIPSGEVLKAADTLGADVIVVVGRDWHSLLHHFTKAAVTITTNAGPTTTTAPSATTTTTVGGAADSRFLPVDPKTHGVLVGCPKT